MVLVSNVDAARREIVMPARTKIVGILLYALLMPSAALADRALPPGRPLPGGFGAPAPGFAGKRVAPQGLQPGSQPIAAPHPSGAAVIELMEDDAGRMARCLAAGDDPAKLGKSGAWGEDCFAGVCALKVAGYQCYRSNIPGWAFPIVEKPRAGEYRYIRFAWKRPEGAGIMVQLSVSGGMDWGRYFAGQNTVGFYPALQVNPNPPRDWEVVTRDLFADFGNLPFNLTGFAFTSMDGVALFDHVYLGRTIADLDKVTEAARFWRGRAGTLGDAQLAAHWKNLASEDAAVRQPSLWALGACGSASVPYITSRIKIPDTVQSERRIKQAVADLDAARFAVREAAYKELESVGITALPHLEAALTDGISFEWRTRLEKLIATCRGEETILSAPQLLTLRAMRVLEQAATEEAQELLEKQAIAKLDAGLSLDARAAVARMKKRRP
jgi:hypothetical protein